jgi:hypothetical protein
MSLVRAVDFREKKYLNQGCVLRVAFDRAADLNAWDRRLSSVIASKANL